MTIDHEVQKRVAAIVEKAAKARGQRYEVEACEAAIHAMHEEGAISADYRDLLLARVGNLLVPWSAESVKNYWAETERQIAAGGLTPTDIAELGLVLLQLVEQRLVQRTTRWRCRQRRWSRCWQRRRRRTLLPCMGTWCRTA